MEKQRYKSISESCRRLLIFFTVFAIFNSVLYAQNLTTAEINQLRIIPAEEQSLFTKTDIRFEVLIPKIKPSQVQILSATLPRDVNFRTMRKSEDFEDGGTKVELWYSFDKKGTYELPVLPVMIQNRRRNIRFRSITLTDDPSKQSPQLVVVFSNGSKFSSSDEPKSAPIFNAKTGEKQKLTVYVQYISQLVQFSWDIPKDSIFTETQTYDITEIKYREKNYTHELIPVASFEWTGLTTGKLPMLKIRAIVTDYNGYRSELYLPEGYVDFVENNISTYNTDDIMFDDAFSAKKSSSSNSFINEITEENCIKLAELYSAERNTLFHFSQYHKNRVDYEASLGLPSTTQGDFSIGFLHIAGIVCLVILILLIFFIKKKNLILILFFSALFICSLVPLVNLSLKRKDSFAICKGISIHSVPEEKSEAVSEIGAGNRVHITEKAGKWVYIEFGETGGWGLKDNVILIK